MVGIEKNATYTIIGGPRESGAGRLNYLPNPSPEIDTTGWSGAPTGVIGLTSVIARSTAQVHTRQASFAVTTPGGASTQGIHTNNNQFPLASGQTVTGSTWIYVPTTQSMRIALQDNNLGNGVVSATQTITANTWTRMSVTWTPTGTSANAMIYIYTLANAAAMTFYVDDLMVVDGTTTPPYFDGDSPGYAWTGTRFNSTSYQNGTRAVLNDQNDPDYVGVVTDISGIDSPEVIESAEDNIEEDGFTHGRFFHGRRPIVFEGLMYGHSSITVRNQRQQRLSSAVNALRSDGVVRWSPQGYEEMYAKVRKQQPLRITGDWNKQFQAPLVAADPRIYSVQPNSASITPSGSGTAGRSYDRSYNVNFDWAPSRGTASVTNSGDGNSPPVLTLKGTMTDPAIQNNTTEEEIALNISLGATDTLVIDMRTKTVTLNGNTAMYSAVDLTRSWWWQLIPGANTINLLAQSYSGTPSLTIDWHDAWI